VYIFAGPINIISTTWGSLDLVLHFAI